jgi:hypothetical protein
MKKIVDERIVGLQKKFGFEALYLVSFLVLVDFMVRIVLFKKGFMECMDLYLIFLLPWLYYDIRGLFGGIFTDISKHQKLINKLTGVFICAVLLLVTLLGFVNDGTISKFSSIDFAKGFITGLAIVAFGAIIVIFTAKRQLKKEEVEEDDQ